MEGIPSELFAELVQEMGCCWEGCDNGLEIQTLCQHIRTDGAVALVALCQEHTVAALHEFKDAGVVSDINVATVSVHVIPLNGNGGEHLH